MKKIFVNILHGIHGNPVTVKSVEVNPVDYAMASMIGAVLRDKVITLTFSKIINHKLKSQELSKNFPLSAKNLMRELDKYDPIKDISTHYYLVTQLYLSMILATHHRNFQKKPTKYGKQ